MKNLSNLDLVENYVLRGGFEVVSSLPTTNLFVGRKVCYSGKDYIYNGTAWTNDATTVGNYSLQDIKNYIASRGENLITNGSALMGNNTNFSQFTFDGSQAYYSNGSFKYVGKATICSNEYMPVNPNIKYKLDFFAKSLLNTGRYYAFIDCYDVDGLQIDSLCSMYVANTLTTLAQELKNGDSVVYLTSAANWDNVGINGRYSKSFIFWDYQNSFGYLYPPLTYSRHNSGPDMWANGSVNTSNNTITLKSAWTGGTIAAGTQLSNGNYGGAFKYLALAYTLIPNTWTNYNGVMDGVDLSGTNAKYKFPPGTAKVKLRFTTDYTNTGDTVWFTNLSFAIDLDTNETINCDRNNVEPTQTGSAVTKTSSWWRQYNVQSINFIWSAIKGITNGYLPYYDSTAKKLKSSPCSVNGTVLKTKEISSLNGVFNQNLARINLNSSSITGTIKIELPNGWNSAMNLYKIGIYDYMHTLGSEILISGFNKSPSSSWEFSNCSILGSYDKGVRLGYNTTTSKCCILLGTTSTVWYYTSVFLKEVMCQYTSNGWSTGYSISLITDESNITGIVTPPLDNSHHLSVTANNGFYKGTLGNDYLLEAGGGHKAITDFATSAQGTKADTALQAITTTLEGNLINSATAKTTPVDADMVGLMDSAASNILKKLSWANIKATLKTYFDSLYALTGHNHNEVYLGKTAQAVDSDKLDGKHASEFATASHTHTISAITDLTTVNNLTNYYLKTETYTQAQVNNLISQIVTLNMLVVTDLPTSNISTTTIYLKPKTTAETNNIYNEYIYINSAWELIGDTTIDLSNYYNKTEIDDKFNNKQNSVIQYTEMPTTASLQALPIGTLFIVNNTLFKVTSATPYYQQLDIQVFTTLPTTYQGNQIQYNSMVYTWNGSAYKCDADTLDGQHASAFALSSHTHTLSAITDLETVSIMGVTKLKDTQVDLNHFCSHGSVNQSGLTVAGTYYLKICNVDNFFNNYNQRITVDVSFIRGGSHCNALRFDIIKDDQSNFYINQIGGNIFSTLWCMTAGSVIIGTDGYLYLKAKIAQCNQFACHVNVYTQPSNGIQYKIDISGLSNSNISATAPSIRKELVLLDNCVLNSDDQYIRCKGVVQQFYIHSGIPLTPSNFVSTINTLLLTNTIVDFTMSVTGVGSYILELSSLTNAPIGVPITIIMKATGSYAFAMGVFETNSGIVQEVIYKKLTPNATDDTLRFQFIKLKNNNVIVTSAMVTYKDN